MFLLSPVLTCGALFWLLYRAWLTLWKPLPELIAILGVEVPDSPNVSLAGIKADAITLHWSRPEANKPVIKYLIQVNGVNVGDSGRNETAITVTGLKPAHFYNVRVISVGPNNFQAGSSVIRLRTYGKDGRPILENGRTPSNFFAEEPQKSVTEDTDDESRGQTAGVEAAALPEGSLAMKREPSIGNQGRRNTGGRKHSPSTTASDPRAPANRSSHQPEESMQQLTEKFEAIRREIEEIMTQVAKDTDDFKYQMSDFMKERDEKRQALKEKEEAREKLKTEVNYSERANRQAQNRKTAKEKVLREKQAERTKMHEDLARWKKEIESMKVERQNWKLEKQKLDQEKEARAEELRATIRQRQTSLNCLEEEIRIKGLQIKELEEERQSLPGAQDDDDSRARDAIQRQRDIEWEIKEKGLVAQLNDQSLNLRLLESELHHQNTIFVAFNARQSNNPLMYHGNSSSVDFDPTRARGEIKSRRSHNPKSPTNTISSPVAGYPITNSAFLSTATYNNQNNNITSPSFAPGPYFDLSNDTAMVPLSEHMSGMSEADIRALTAGAPLSPTATSLLPSNIFADDDPPSSRAGSTRSPGPSLFHNLGPSHGNEAQSPSSSSRSASLIPSPQSSANNLAMYGVSGRDYAQENERRSLNSQQQDFGVIGSHSRSEQSSTTKSFRLFGFSRARGKTLQEGHALGTLKQGQSQSFPRSMEEPESINNRPRRTSFSANWKTMPSFLTRSSTASDATEGNGPAPARNVGARTRRGFNMFNSSIDDPNIYSERNPSSPRPLSIASSDLPRPSTDSAPFGWPAAEGLLNKNSPLATNWSINAPQTWSRDPSRRPSIQHGSTTALTTGIASEDDEYLPPETLTAQTSPPPAGVIGSRPISSHKPVTPKLNPAAPAFKGMFGRNSKVDKDRKGKGKEPSTTELSVSSDVPSRPATSPSESRKSRDAHSIRTQYSMSESHDGLNLERTSSNTPSEMTTPSATSGREKDKSFRQLLRKGSSSKFSLASGIFGGKKSGGSIANCDRNASGERGSSLDECGEDVVLGRNVDSVTSSPMTGALGTSEMKEKDGKDGQVAAPKEGRMSYKWARLGFKNNKDKKRESSDIEMGETEETDDEGRD